MLTSPANRQVVLTPAILTPSVSEYLSWRGKKTWKLRNEENSKNSHRKDKFSQRLACRHLVVSSGVKQEVKGPFITGSISINTSPRGWRSDVGLLLHPHLISFSDDEEELPARNTFQIFSYISLIAPDFVHGVRL